MDVLGRDKLLLFCVRHGNARHALARWLKDVEESVWQTPWDIKAKYASADFLAGNRVIFNIKGNHYRLATRVEYKRGNVAIEWIGTHAEYDKKDFS